MTFSRRTFLKGMVATAAGILVPIEVAAEPERRIWQLDQTMVTPQPLVIEVYAVGHDADGQLRWVGPRNYERLNPRTDNEIIRVSRVLPDGTFAFERMAPASEWAEVSGWQPS